MALKRSSPLDDPPSASSSSSSSSSSSTSSTSSSGAESEEINDTKEQEHEQNKGIAESEEEEEEESGDEEEEEEVENKTPPPVQTPTPTPTATPQPQSSSDSEGSDSEDSGGTQTSPTASDFAVKPIISKPMDDSSTKLKKPTLESPKSGAKRPAESEEKKEPQKKKRKVAANGDEKKSAINRLWSEDDEIVVLKGMIDFQKKKGPISHADMGAFLDFIKKSLHVDVSKNQLVEKVRRLKKKYWSGAVKGEEPVFSKPHDIKCLELAKKIWGGGGGGSSNAFVEGVKSNGRKARKGVKVSNSPKEEEQQLALQNGLNGEVKEGLNGEVKDTKVGQADFCSMYPCLQGSLERYANLSEAGRNFIKGSMSLIGSVKAKELEEKWKKFRDDEVALYLQELEFIQEQTKLIFEAMKSSNS